MKLPFKIKDGKRTRICEYKDLFIIAEFGLKFNIYTKRRYLLSWKLPESVLYIIYASIKAIKEANRLFPMNYLGVISIVDNHQIGHITCKELHKWRSNSMVKLIVELECR